MINRLFFASLLVLLFGCKNQTESVLINFLNENGIESTEKLAVVVIPLEGCLPCIEKTIEYSKQTADSELIYILETFGSEKSLNMRYSSKQLQNNFIIDEEEKLIKEGVIAINPVIFLLSKNSSKRITVTDSNFQASVFELEEFLQE